MTLRGGATQLTPHAAVTSFDVTLGTGKTRPAVGDFIAIACAATGIGAARIVAPAGLTALTDAGEVVNSNLTAWLFRGYATPAMVAAGKVTFTTTTPATAYVMDGAGVVLGDVAAVDVIGTPVLETTVGTSHTGATVTTTADYDEVVSLVATRRSTDYSAGYFTWPAGWTQVASTYTTNAGATNVGVTAGRTFPTLKSLQGGAVVTTTQATLAVNYTLAVKRPQLARTAFGSVIVGGVEQPLSAMSVAQGGVDQLIYGLDLAEPKRPTSLHSGYPGGGGQTCIEASPNWPGLIVFGTDTGGPRISVDYGAHSHIHMLGLAGGVSGKQFDGIAFSPTVVGQAYFTGGDGTTAASGVYVVTNAHRRHQISPLVRIDGVAGPKLRFQGGNNTDSRMGATGKYSRHYGRIIAVDEWTMPGFALIHVATVGDGAWRIKLDLSTNTPVEQVQYAGTAGLVIRSLKLGTNELNPAANVYSRIILNAYDVASGGTPRRPLLCINANASGSNPTLATATIAALPVNVENIAHWHAPGAGTVPLTVAVTSSGQVFFSSNAFASAGADVSAAAAAVTATNVARTAAQNDGPETTSAWISVGGTIQGSNYVVLVGAADGGRTIDRNGRKFNTVWRGVVSATAATPASAVTWTPLSGPYDPAKGLNGYWCEYVLGDFTRPWYLADVNTPGCNGTASVSHITVDPLDPSKLYITSKGASYRSRDFGLHWEVVAGFGSADHTTVHYDDGVNENDVGTTSGDWPGIMLHNAPGVEPFTRGSAEPLAVIVDAKYAAQAMWTDPLTGEWFIGGTQATSGNAGHSVPNTDDGNNIWCLTSDQLRARLDTLTGSLKLNTGSGAGVSVGGPMAGATVYGIGQTTRAKRAVLTACHGNKGLFWTNTSAAATPTWNLVSAVSGTLQPYRGGVWQGSTSSVQVDRTRACVFWFDRYNGAAWRVQVATDGTVSSASLLYRSTFTYGVSRDACGYVALDEANNRLWISTRNGVVSIDNASGAAHLDLSAGKTGTENAVAAPWSTYYSGEYVGPIAWLPTPSALFVTTLMYADGSGTPLYPANGSDGPRALLVSRPEVAKQWAPAVVTDYAATRDRGWRMGYGQPKSISRHKTGKQLAMSSQGNGVAVAFLPEKPIIPVTDRFVGTFSADRWPSSTGVPTTSGGRLRLPCTTAGTRAVTSFVFDLRENPVSVGLVKVPAAGAGGTLVEVWLRAAAAASQVKFTLTGDQSLLTLTGTGMSVETVPYSPTRHRYLRYSLSADGTKLRWEASPDSAVWTVLRSVATPSWITAELLRAHLVCSYSGSETAPGYAEFDAFNVALNSATTPDPTPATRRLTRDTSTGRVMAGTTPVRSGGINVFQLIVNDYPSNRLMSTAEIDSLLEKAVTLNARFVRSHTLAANAGSASYNLVTGVSGSGSNPTIIYNEAVWQRMDYAIAKAGQLGLYLMPAMFDQAAVSFSNNFAGSVLTWVKFRQPSATNWELFYSDTQCQYDQRKFLKDFANRVNTVNGLRYADDPTLFAWQQGNEMWKADSYRKWITDTAAAMKAAAPKMLVWEGTGADISSYWRSAGQDQDPVAHVVTSTALADPNIDGVDIHPYSEALTSDVETMLQRAAAAGKVGAVWEYPWTKTTGNAPAPDLEALVRRYPNALTSAPWSLQNDADLHNNGAAIGSDDVSLYVPGKDATTQAMVARVTAHGAALQAG